MSQSASAHLNRYTCYGAIEVVAIIIIIIIIFFLNFKPSKNEGRKKIEKVKKNGEANVPSGRPTQNYCATKQN